LIRYTARGAVSLARLEADANGDLLSTFTRPWSDGTTGIKLSPLELLEKLAALVPLPRMHLVRYGGCLAPHSQLRGSITPTPRQQGMDAPEAGSASPRWGWARLLKRVVAFDLERCPACGRGTLRIIAAITHVEVIRTMLRHLKLAPDPLPIAPARACQDRFAWASPSPDSASSRVPWAGQGRGAPARRPAGRVWRARARERCLAEHTEEFFGSTGWVFAPRGGAGDGWTPRKMCFKITIR
jgi:hypothetical protein